MTLYDLFSFHQGIQLFGCGVAWLILNAAAIFICMWIKLKVTNIFHHLFISNINQSSTLFSNNMPFSNFIFFFHLQLNKQMELCMSFINSGLIKHNIILGLDDRGKISCQKVNLCFIYFDPTECIVSFFIYVMTKSTSFYHKLHYFK